MLVVFPFQHSALHFLFCLVYYVLLESLFFLLSYSLVFIHLYLSTTATHSPYTLLSSSHFTSLIRSHSFSLTLCLSLTQTHTHTHKHTHTHSLSEVLLCERLRLSVATEDSSPTDPAATPPSSLTRDLPRL